MMEPWFNGRYARRLDDELQALDAREYRYEIDAASRASGRIVLTVKWPAKRPEHDLTVLFPDNYPYFPFDISSPSIPGGRHKSPYGNFLCLMQDPLQNWSVDDTLAQFLDSQVDKIIKAHRAEGASDLEAHEAMQVSTYLTYMAGMIVLTGDWKIDAAHTRGFLSVGVEHGTDPDTLLRAAVIEVQDAARKPLAGLDSKLHAYYGRTIPARWIRLPHPPKSSVPVDILGEAIAHWKDLATPRFQHGPDIIGILIPEEVQYGQYHENWLFVVRRKHHVAKDGQVHFQVYCVRSDRASREVLLARAHRLSPLGQKKILIVGLGSIGSGVAWQMARAGVSALHMIDCDTVQLGNVPRWALGWEAVGHGKAEVLANQLQQAYRFLDVKFWPLRLGGTKQTPQHLTDVEVLPQALEDVDLILDATAERCVSHFLSDMARERGIRYIWAYGTPGGWGGAVGRVLPGKTQGCWKCYQRHMTDGIIKRPHQEDAPEVQTVGCQQATFTGTGFDMDHVSLAAARLATSTLCAGTAEAYPDFEWDVGIVDLWDSRGIPVAPQWHTYKLERHPDCDCHG